MKKSIYLLAALSMFSIISCQEEIGNNYESMNESTGTTLKASVINTKVSANPVGVFAWQTSDKIAVLDDNGDAHEFTATSTGATSEFTCASSINLGAYAQYPYSSSFAGLVNELDFQIPGTITYSADATNMPMLGKISGDAATFKAVGGLLKLVVFGVPSDATMLQFTATNKKISGGFTITDASIADPVIVTTSKGSGDDSIIIDFDGNRSDNMVFYIPLPTGTIDGFTLEFDDTDDTSITSTKNLSIDRNDIIVAPAINLIPTTTIWRETFTGYLADKEWTTTGNINTSATYDAEGNSAITYTTTGSGTKLYTGSMSAGAPSGEPEILINGSFTIDNIPTNNKANFILTYYSNKGTGTLSVTSNEDKVKFGKATNSGKLYTIPITIENPTTVDEIDLVFSASSNSRLDDVKLVYDPKVEVTPTITFAGSLTRTIGAGNLTANITGITLNNPLDGNGIGIVSDVNWLTPTLAGTTLSCTATGYNHDEDARVGHVTLKATGAANQTFSITQNPSIVSKPTITATPGNASFSITWVGDTKAKSYIGYYATSDLVDPTTGTALSISNADAAFTGGPSGAVVNGTTYYVFVKVNEVADAYADKYTASTLWAKTTVKPVAETPTAVYSVIKTISELSAGSYLMGSNNNNSFSGSTSIALWSGSVSSNKLSKTDTRTWDTETCDFDSVTGAATVVIESAGSTNVWRIKVGTKYLAASGTSFSLQDDTFDWTFENRGTNDGVDFYNTTSGTYVSCNSASDVARAYDGSGKKYKGIYFFRKN